MITKGVLPKTYKFGQTVYRFSDGDAAQILEEGGYIDPACVEKASRSGKQYHELRKHAIHKTERKQGVFR